MRAAFMAFPSPANGRSAFVRRRTNASNDEEDMWARQKASCDTSDLLLGGQGSQRRLRELKDLHCAHCRKAPGKRAEGTSCAFVHLREWEDPADPSRVRVTQGYLARPLPAFPPGLDADTWASEHIRSATAGLALYLLKRDQLALNLYRAVPEVCRPYTLPDTSAEACFACGLASLDVCAVCMQCGQQFCPECLIFKASAEEMEEKDIEEAPTWLRDRLTTSDQSVGREQGSFLRRLSHCPQRGQHSRLIDSSLTVLRRYDSGRASAWLRAAEQIAGASMATDATEMSAEAFLAAASQHLEAAGFSNKVGYDRRYSSATASGHSYVIAPSLHDDTRRYLRITIAPQPPTAQQAQAVQWCMFSARTVVTVALPVNSTENAWTADQLSHCYGTDEVVATLKGEEISLSLAEYLELWKDPESGANLRDYPLQPEQARFAPLMRSWVNALGCCAAVASPAGVLNVLGAKRQHADQERRDAFVAGPLSFAGGSAALVEGGVNTGFHFDVADADNLLLDARRPADRPDLPEYDAWWLVIDRTQRRTAIQLFDCVELARQEVADGRLEEEEVQKRLAVLFHEQQQSAGIATTSSALDLPKIAIPPSWLPHLQKLGLRYWEVGQRLGDLITVPCGSAHQVRNNWPCIKVAGDYLGDRWSLEAALDLSRLRCCRWQQHPKTVAPKDSFFVDSYILTAFISSVQE